jgi:hypothetical protein
MLKWYVYYNDLPKRITDEFAGARSNQAYDENKLKETQRESYSNEKETIITTRTKLKLMGITVENNIELTRTQAQHRIQLRQCLRAQKARLAKRMKSWSLVLDRDVSIKVTAVSGSSSMSASQASSAQGKSEMTSRSQSKTASRRGSDGKISEKMQEMQPQADASKIMDETNLEDAADLALMNSDALEKQQEKAKKEINELTTKLKAFQQNNARALADLKNAQAKMLKNKEEESQKFMLVCS